MTAPTPPLSAEARLAALRQDLEALADEWEAEVARGHWCGECFAPDDERNELRAVLAEHATPSDDTAAMWIDPNPPGVTPLPPERARPILDALDDADTEGVRLTEDERQYLRSLVRDMFPTDYGRSNFEAWVEDAAQQAEVVVERIKADAYNAGLVEGANIGIHMRAATEGKGEA